MTIEHIKNLRQATGKSMLEVKEALIQADDDYEKALVLLNKSHTKADGNDRVPSKGLTKVIILENEAILFEINAETDFASKHLKLIELMDFLGNHFIKSEVTNPKSALKLSIGNQSAEAHIDFVSGIMKERLILRRLYRVKKQDTQRFGSYTHLGGKVSTLIILNQNHDTLARDLAMQVAANAPSYLRLDTIDLDTIQYEKMLFEKTHGRLNEKVFLEELKLKTLEEQAFIKNPDILIKDLLKRENVELIDFFRFEVGQGILDKLSCRLELPCDGSLITLPKT
jgi:elongation factor Ts